MKKKFDELKAGDVVQLGSEERVVLFTKTGKLQGYAYALLSEQGESWKIERREIRGHGHDNFVEVRGDKSFQVTGNLLRGKCTACRGTGNQTDYLDARTVSGCGSCLGTGYKLEAA